MKKVSITISKNYKDAKFSYPKVKKNKKRELREKDKEENKENIRPNSLDFWDDCKK